MKKPSKPIKKPVIVIAIGEKKPPMKMPHKIPKKPGKGKKSC